jgi:hypothetical protein
VKSLHLAVTSFRRPQQSCKGVRPIVVTRKLITMSEGVIHTAHLTSAAMPRPAGVYAAPPLRRLPPTLRKAVFKAYVRFSDREHEMLRNGMEHFGVSDLTVCPSCFCAHGLRIRILDCISLLYLDRPIRFLTEFFPLFLLDVCRPAAGNASCMPFPSIRSALPWT